MPSEPTSSPSSSLVELFQAPREQVDPEVRAFVLNLLERGLLQAAP